MQGQAVVVGVGESEYYKRGGSPETEFQLALKAIGRAAEDAGLELSKIDGLISYMDDRNDPLRLSAALGLELSQTEVAGVWQRLGLEPGPDLVERLVEARLGHADAPDGDWRFAHALLREALVGRASDAARPPTSRSRRRGRRWEPISS